MVSQTNKESQLVEELLYHGHWANKAKWHCSTGFAMCTSSIEECILSAHRPLQRFCNIEMIALLMRYSEELRNPTAELFKHS